MKNILENTKRKLILLKILLTDYKIKQFSYEFIFLKQIGYGLEDVNIEKRVLMTDGKIFSMKNKTIQYYTEP